MNTMYEMGVDMKTYRTWSKLNSNTKIRVKTGVGYTEWSSEGAMIGQGTGGGALVSQANLDKGMTEMFTGSEDEIGYGSVRMIPLMFQDDVMRVAEGVNAARAGNIKVASTMQSKQLRLNQDKTSFIIFGKKKQKDAARQEVHQSPIMCGDFITREKYCDKWLGDMFHGDGLGECVLATIKERKAKVKSACFEAAAIVEDWRSQCIGGFKSALDLFELAILPTLLNNADTWVDITEEAVNMLEDMQLFFVRLVLRVPKSTPKPALRSETGLMSMKLRIWKKKVMMIHHLKNLSDSSLAKQVWREQLQQDWPGLAREASIICEELGIKNVNESQTGRQELKTLVNNACRGRNERELKEQMQGMSKMEDLMSQDCNAKPYLESKSLNEVRETFRLRTKMIEGIRGNFKNMYPGDKGNCEGCGKVLETQAHVVVCEEFSDIREGLDMSKDRDMVKYFKGVLERRRDNEKEK